MDSTRGMMRCIGIVMVLALSQLSAAIVTTPYNSYPFLESNQTDLDQQLTNDIQQALSKGSKARKYQNVYVSVSYSNVTLEGSVNTLDDKAQLTRDVLSVKGVKQIDNKVTVLSPYP